MQSKNGGWAAFDVDNDLHRQQDPPDHGAHPDPPRRTSRRMLEFALIGFARDSDVVSGLQIRPAANSRSAAPGKAAGA
jgi:hypothetical protein